MLQPRRGLRKHCAWYIDSKHRLQELIYCVESTRDWIQGTTAAPFLSLPLYACSQLLRPITTVYLAPFGAAIDAATTALWVRDLFSLLSQHLSRLVVDFTLPSGHGADGILSYAFRAAFLALGRLEDLVSIRAEASLEVLSSWGINVQLRRLALHNVDVYEGFCENVRAMPQLETVVVTRAKGLDYVSMKNA